MAKVTCTEVISEEDNEEPKRAQQQGETPPSEAKQPQRLVLRLEPRRHITFSPDTVDNERLNKKSSKRCCIYHKPRA